MAETKYQNARTAATNETETRFEDDDGSDKITPEFENADV